MFSSSSSKAVFAAAVVTAVSVAGALIYKKKYQSAGSECKVAAASTPAPTAVSSPAVVADPTQTFVLVHTAAFMRGMVGQLISKLESRGFVLSAMSMRPVPKGAAGERYGLSAAGPVLAMVWQGKEAAALVAAMLAASSNFVYCSASAEAAAEDVALWFSEGVTASRASPYKAWVQE